MFLSAKAFFDPVNLDLKKTLYRRAETQLPNEFIKLYKRNVVSGTPKKTGALRRSIITQALGTRAEIGWRAPYAQAQEDGGHLGAKYSNYTTPGTGPHFARNAFMATSSQMQAVYRELGLTS